MTVTTLSEDSIAGLAEPRVDALKVTVDAKMDLREGHWDAALRRQEIWIWAEREDGTVDLAKAARGHAVADLKPEGRDATREDLKLPIAGVEDGELIGIGNGIRNALARLDQTKDLSADVEAKARETLRSMLDRLNEQTARDLADGFGVPFEDAVALVADANDTTSDTPMVTHGAFLQACWRGMRDDRDPDALRYLSAEFDTQAKRRALIAAADDGAVVRWSRVHFDLDEAQAKVIDRAIEIGDRLAERGDAEEFRAIAEELRTDGFSDHINGGFLQVDVLAARSGNQTYTDGRTQWVEFRSADEVGDPESLASYDGKPLTDDHPPVMVTPANFTKYAKGSCGQGAALLDVAGDGNRYVKLRIFVGDLATLRKIRDGKLELSAGYTTVTVRDSGVSPDGQPFDFRQTRIRINHLALVDRGRAGPLARIQLDGAAWELPATSTDAQEQDMKKDQLDPETARMWLAAVVAYQHPESPEAAGVALEQLAAMTGLESEEIRSMLAVEAAAAPDPELELIEMDGIEARMTPDHAAKYRERQQEQETMTVDTAKINKDMAEKLAEQTAVTSGLQRQVDGLLATKAQAELGALHREIADVCPQLGASWDALKAKGEFKLDAKGMREAATIDLDPEAIGDLNAVRDSETFDATLGGLYKAAVRGAHARKRAANSTDTNPTGTTTGPTLVVDAMDQLSANAGGFYGSK